MRLIFLTFLIITSHVALCQEPNNMFPLYSKGTYSAGSASDMTDITNAQLKLKAESGYIRVPHLSAHLTASAVYNFETGKNVYWGEFGDAGQYIFRGRTMIISDNTSFGTYSPSTKLEITGSDANVALKIRHAAESVNFGISIRQASDLKGFLSCDGRDFQITAGWNKSLILGSSEFTNYGGKVIFPGGNVGIGSLNPDAKLTVKGDIHASEVRIDLEDEVAPDYVFEKDYNLLPLAEVEAYINENKHLPEVPSAREMEAKGLNVKEMNLLLLKKVEELTLHLIEMKKENETMKERLDKLENK